MLFIVLLGLGIVCVSTFSAGQTTVVMCHSFGCIHNRKGRCIRKEVVVYDNTVLGLCLNHSDTMSKRILEPMNKGIAVERSKPNPQMITKIMQVEEKAKDSELIKNPKAFAEWMKRRGVRRL